jgi:hypothetical protein
MIFIEKRARIPRYSTAGNNAGENQESNYAVDGLE